MKGFLKFYLGAVIVCSSSAGVFLFEVLPCPVTLVARSMPRNLFSR